MPTLHYPLGNTYSTTTSSTPINTATNPLLGISDPSSALALQTLLATVSQVKAAAAEVGASAPAPAPIPAMPPVTLHYPGYAGAAPMMMPDYGSTVQGTSSSPLPLVLQQLQGMLSNSNQQNLGFGSNNNSMVSNNISNSTAPSSTTPPSTTTASSAGVSSSVMSAMSGAIDPRTGGPAMSSLPHGFPGAGAPGGGMPRDPRAAVPIDPRAQQQQLQGMGPMDPRADPRLMTQQGRPGPGGVGGMSMGGAQPLSGSAQPLYQQAQSLFQGAHAAGVPPLNLGSLLEGQNGGVGGGGAMLMRNAAAGGVDVGALGMHKAVGGGAGLDGHAMAQLASFMNGAGVSTGGSLPYQQAGRGENGKGAQPSGSPFPYSGIIGGASSIHNNGGQSRPGVNGGGQDGYPRRVGGEHMNGGRRGSMDEKGNGNQYGVKEDPSIGPDQIRGMVYSRCLGHVFFSSHLNGQLLRIYHC
ncbi:MAG: hypothetical protein J3R72DRAFT_109539 [Linnemannia gamsii]|nr:MAG: hypothetical protein J3R72DRAFT_109539 [Linnemannia gamsii]